MKRSPELKQLSRDHHQALFAALRWRRAGDGDAAAAEVFLDFWDAGAAILGDTAAATHQ